MTNKGRYHNHMHHLFAYGTLQRPDIHEQLFGRRLFGVMDTLEQESGLIDGIVYELTVDELEKTDAHEGEKYTRIKVTLVSGRQAWMYIAAGS